MCKIGAEPYECGAVCPTEEIYEEVVTTLMNRYQGALGLKATPHPGEVRPELFCKVEFFTPIEQKKVTVYVATTDTKSKIPTSVTLTKEIKFCGGHV